MLWWPYKRETIVSSLSEKELMTRLDLITSPPVRSKKYLDQKASFIGTLDKNHFRISPKVNAPENFLPIIEGTIDTTSMGCIIFLKFKLFFSSMMFLTFWSGITLLVGAFFIFIIHQTNLGLLSISAGLINYFFTVYFFSRKVKESFNRLLNELKMT